MSEFDVSVIASIVTGIGGLVSGTVGYYLVHRFLERKREFLSTKRQQLQHVFAPLEILMRTNKRASERFFTTGTTVHDKEFIERNIWYPNHTEAMKILMEKAHLLPEIPQVFLDLITHINVWLTEYDLIYVKRKKKGPAFAGTRGYPYPSKADTYVIERAAELRKTLNL